MSCYLFMFAIRPGRFNADRIAATATKDEQEKIRDDDYCNFSADMGDDILFTAGTASSARSSFKGTGSLSLDL